MNFRKTMFFILCMLTVRCHAGRLFTLLRLGKGVQFWVSRNCKLNRRNKKLLNGRLETEAISWRVEPNYVSSHDVLIAYLKTYPLVIVSGDYPNAARRFMNEIDQRYKNNLPKAHFDENSDFMHVHVKAKKTIISFYGSEQI